MSAAFPLVEFVHRRFQESLEVDQHLEQANLLLERALGHLQDGARLHKPLDKEVAMLLKVQTQLGVRERCRHHSPDTVASLVQDYFEQYVSDLNSEHINRLLRQLGRDQFLSREEMEELRHWADHETRLLELQEVLLHWKENIKKLLVRDEEGSRKRKKPGKRLVKA